MKKKILLLLLILSMAMPTNVQAADRLTKRAGVHVNSHGFKETYYNLPMEGIVRRMRAKGYSEEQYPYWIREDGAKMLGPLVMVAADLNVHHRGKVIHTSLGPSIVCDTGSAIKGRRIDIATAW